MEFFLNEFKMNILNYLIYIETIDHFYLIFILCLFSIILFSIPIPGSFLVIINASFLGFGGFFVSYISCVISSIIVYFFFKKLFFKKNKLLPQYNFIEKSKNNLYTLILCRVIVPFPICSYLLSFIKVKIKKYLFATIIGTIPGTLSITLAFASMKNAILKNSDININLFKDPIFLISLIIIFSFIFFSHILKKRYLK